MTKKRVLVSTIYKADNYGAIFQAYSLGEYLKSRGAEVEFLQQIPEKIDRQFTALRTYSIKAFAKDLFRFLPRKKLVSKVEQFVADNFNEVPNYDDEKHDLLISGSDQIWNPKIVSFDNKFEDCYFFSGSKVKKVSYASSLGDYRYSQPQMSEFKNLVSDYHRITVREEDTAKYLSDETGIDVTSVLDPTLIQSFDFWNSMVSKNEPCKDYILVYFNNASGELTEIVNRFKAKLGIDVVVINNWYCKELNYDRYVRDAGPLDFLQLFSNAKYVLTNTFHGVCFSVNYKKNFLYIDSGVHSNRVHSLMSKVSAEYKLVQPSISDEELIRRANAGIQYDQLAMEQKRSTEVINGYME
ncbi:putative Polysaccharide pyruvyl transferase [Vibrio coralliirubri]|uniref:polysaccharide pyruvyl transferase family protein n=1 Tax=Vibrio coralliirubri TaxID=1516159 RepID=UPI00063194C0|nr:polysaccharide pyruvyl transferase family protein [Vibrio coralliirubri]CDT76203.1 putative Polysaccharide pyruvyl transferase [Vibrio coralliirubri]